jgi:hypothetical protein
MKDFGRTRRSGFESSAAHLAANPSFFTALHSRGGAHAKRQLRHKRIETTERYDRNRSLRDSTSGKLGL